MIEKAILERARAFAAGEPSATYPGLRRFLEVEMENSYRSAMAKIRGIGLDAVPRRSYFMNEEAIQAADEIWESLQEPSPSSFFEGVPYSKGFAAYRAHLENGRAYKPVSKGAYL